VVREREREPHVNILIVIVGHGEWKRVEEDCRDLKTSTPTETLLSFNVLSTFLDPLLYILALLMCLKY
jgi:hypothetical protein